jgi:hypothetical protein
MQNFLNFSQMSRGVPEPLREPEPESSLKSPGLKIEN